MTEKEQKFIDLAVKRMKEAIDANEHNVKEAIKALNMVNGDDHWEEKEVKDRDLLGRPHLQFNMLPQYCDQVTGDIRHIKPQIKVSPADVKSSTEIANIRQGLIDDIQAYSNAEAIYIQAAEMLVPGGWGTWRVLTQDSEFNPFEQEIRLASIPNPFTVIWDPNAKDPNYADAGYCFVVDKMPREEFDKEHPNVNVPKEGFDTTSGIGMEHWYDEDTITVAEYYVVEKVTKTVCLLRDGRVLEKDKAEAIVEAYNAVKKFDESDKRRPEIIKEKEIEDRKIKRYDITIAGILKEYDIPGKYIPIVTVKGKELNIKGKNHVRGLVKNALDPQKMFNFWMTSAYETIDLSPKNPWIGTAKQFEGYENDYKDANRKNYPFLLYNPDPEMPGVPPQRTASPNPPVAIFAQIDKAEALIKSTVGMYGRDLGDGTQEVSGVAIQMAQTPGDVATYAYVDNLVRGIKHTGIIINEMIPIVYDTDRIIRNRQADGSETFVPINTTAGAALEVMKNNPDKFQGMNIDKLNKHVAKEGGASYYNKIDEGRYEITVKVGPSYTTQRQEAASNMLQLVTAYPAIAGIAGDLIVKNMDFKDADLLAQRIEKTLPPGLIPPKPGEQPPPPPPPDPNTIIKQAEVKIKELELQIKQVDLQQEKVKLVNDIQKGAGERRVEALTLLKTILGNNQQPQDFEGMA